MTLLAFRRIILFAFASTAVSVHIEKTGGQMPRHQVVRAHDRINEIATVPAVIKRNHSHEQCVQPGKAEEEPTMCHPDDDVSPEASLVLPDDTHNDSCLQDDFESQDGFGRPSAAQVDLVLKTLKEVEAGTGSLAQLDQVLNQTIFGLDAFFINLAKIVTDAKIWKMSECVGADSNAILRAISHAHSIHDINSIFRTIGLAVDGIFKETLNKLQELHHDALLGKLSKEILEKFMANVQAGSIDFLSTENEADMQEQIAKMLPKLIVLIKDLGNKFVVLKPMSCVSDAFLGEMVMQKRIDDFSKFSAPFFFPMVSFLRGVMDDQVKTMLKDIEMPSNATCKEQIKAAAAIVCTQRGNGTDTEDALQRKILIVATQLVMSQMSAKFWPRMIGKTALAAKVVDTFGVAAARTLCGSTAILPTTSTICSVISSVPQMMSKIFIALIQVTAQKQYRKQLADVLSEAYYTQKTIMKDGTNDAQTNPFEKLAANITGRMQEEPLFAVLQEVSKCETEAGFFVEWGNIGDFFNKKKKEITDWLNNKARDLVNHEPIRGALHHVKDKLLPLVKFLMRKVWSLIFGSVAGYDTIEVVEKLAGKMTNCIHGKLNLNPIQLFTKFAQYLQDMSNPSKDGLVETFKLLRLDILSNDLKTWFKAESPVLQDRIEDWAKVLLQAIIGTSNDLQPLATKMTDYLHHLLVSVTNANYLFAPASCIMEAVPSLVKSHEAKAWLASFLADAVKVVKFENPEKTWLDMFAAFYSDYNGHNIFELIMKKNRIVACYGSGDKGTNDEKTKVKLLVMSVLEFLRYAKEKVMAVVLADQNDFADGFLAFMAGEIGGAITNSVPIGNFHNLIPAVGKPIVSLLVFEMRQLRLSTSFKKLEDSIAQFHRDWLNKTFTDGLVTDGVIDSLKHDMERKSDMLKKFAAVLSSTFINKAAQAFLGNYKSGLCNGTFEKATWPLQPFSALWDTE